MVGYGASRLTHPTGYDWRGVERDGVVRAEAMRMERP